MRLLVGLLGLVALPLTTGGVVRGSRNLKKSKFYHDDYGYSLDGFKLACYTELYHAAADSGLTQVDYAHFLYDYCDKSKIEGPACRKVKKDDVAFPSLSVDLQLNFVRTVCPGGDASAYECLEAMNETGEDFYYTEEIEELCASTYPLLLSSGLVDPGTCVDEEVRGTRGIQDILTM